MNTQDREHPKSTMANVPVKQPLPPPVRTFNVPGGTVKLNPDGRVSVRLNTPKPNNTQRPQ